MIGHSDRILCEISAEMSSKSWGSDELGNLLQSRARAVFANAAAAIKRNQLTRKDVSDASLLEEDGQGVSKLVDAACESVLRGMFSAEKVAELLAFEDPRLTEADVMLLLLSFAQVSQP